MNENVNTAGAAEVVDPVAAAREQKRMEAAKRRRRKKIIKRIVILVILLAVAGLIWFGVYELFLKPEPVPAPQTTFSYRGGFSSSVSGYGQVKANRTESVSAPAEGQLLQLLVAEGDTVTEGQPLFTMDDSTLRAQIEELEKKIESINKSIDDAIESRQRTAETRAEVYESLADYDKQIAEAEEKVASRNLTAPFAGKLLDVGVKKGDTVTEGQEIGTLVRDGEMKLTSYFSYAYENAVYLGQTAKVSIPSSMEVITGKVTRIDKVRYITEEGGVLFAVEVTIPNPGALTKDMNAMAVLVGTDGSEITPAEQSALEYAETETLTAPAKGKILDLNMTAFAEYAEGAVLYTLSDDGYAADIESLRDSSKSVRDQVEGYDEQIAGYTDQITEFEKQIADTEAEIEKQNQRFDLFNGVAPMSGLVTAVTAMEGQTIQEGGAILAISDTSSMTVAIDIDEMNIGNVSIGTPVNLTQTTGEGEMYYSGTITQIALEGNYDWGYTTYPATITIDGGEGLRANSSMYYEIVLSQKDDCVLVPINAVKYTEAGLCVFVRIPEGGSAPDDAVELAEGVVPDGFYAVLVETGLSDEAQVEIVSGIGEGVELYVAEGIPGQDGDMMNPGGGVVSTVVYG